MTDRWAQVRLGDVLALNNRRLGPHAREPEVLSLSKYQGFVRASEYFDKRVASKSLEGYKVVEPEGWAFSTIHIDEGSIARNLLGIRGVISPMYTTLTWIGREHDPRYFALALRSPAMLRTYSAKARGSINRRRSLPYAAFAELTLEVPPLVVQRRIVDLMEHLDTHLANLETERQALELVASGIIANASAKEPPSALGRRIRVTGGRRLPKGVPLTSEANGHPYLRVLDMDKGTFIRDSVQFVPQEALESIKRYKVRAGDLVISIVGTIGRVALVPDWADGANLTENAALIRIEDSDLHREWLAMWLMTPQGQAEVVRVTVGTSQGKLALSRIPLIRVPNISVERQEGDAERAHKAAQAARRLGEEVKTLRHLRSLWLAVLLDGSVDVARSYDSLLAVS